MNHVLLIDDEEGIRHVWKRFHDATEVAFRGRLEMDVAHDLMHGVQKMESTRYDAVILDLKYQGLGADETIKWIEENHQSSPAIIVLTGDEDIFVRRRCMVAGASDFWTKMDAQARPDLFFKAVFNQYLRHEFSTDAATRA